tara:strand:- start:681 stop:842 length:162 start_codon:yes stop_codon:yes gene_type:complete
LGGLNTPFTFNKTKKIKGTMNKNIGGVGKFFGVHPTSLFWAYQPTFLFKKIKQ